MLASIPASILKHIRADPGIPPDSEKISHALGVAPPVPGVHHRNPSAPEGLVGLQDAHACFQGIKRPLAEDDDGDNVIAYVSRPRFLYEYDPNMVSVAVKRPTPRDVVFVAYARLAQAGVSPIGGTLGTITHWGFVEADRSERSLPIHYSSRYRTRLW
jgi:hypothetical protein